MTAQRTRIPPAPAAADDSDDRGRYTVRPFHPDDESAVLDLGGGNLAPVERREWFEWIAHENPYVEHVPMAIVEEAGDVVAALPLWAFRIRAGESEGLAFGCGEPVVALGHDADDLAARAAAGAIDYYVAAALDERPPTGVDVVTGPAVDARAAAADIHEFPAMFFGHGSAETGAVDERVPWTKRSERADDYRIQRHGAFVATRIPGPPGRALGAGISAVTGRVRRARDRRASFETGPYTVMGHHGVPDATLAACFEASTPPDAHVVYDRAFYEWWYSRPGIEDVRTYVVYRGSEVAAGLVAHREAASDAGVDTVRIDNVVPVTGDPDRPDAVAAGMERLLAEHADADVIRTTTPLVPDAVSSAYGFRSGERFPTSLLASGAAVLGIRPLIDRQGTLGNRPLGETAPFLWPLAD